ncbi:MAG TPA: radical SAM protein [Sphingobacteriaceae bacterium]|nr:radical SAM protein [Sphingobacteriaceae bacterium]
MKKILFTHSYFLQFDPKQWKNRQPYPPLGTLYAAAIMRENNYNVSLFDTMFADGPDEILKEINNIQPDIFVIYDDGFNYLTKMCLTNMREAAFRMCRLAKENGCKVIVSSSDSTDRYEEYLNQGADFILLGEADLTLPELVNSIGTGLNNFSEIQGLAYVEDNEIKKTPRRKVLKDLDSVPFPAWDLINIDIYRDTWIKSSGYFSLNMSTTRGCPFKCNWCAKPIYGNYYNSRSPANVVQELKLLKEKFHVDHIWFCDDIFGLKPGWISGMVKLIREEKIDIRFKIQSRADLLLQENTIEDLAAAGCENVWIGAESGSQKILDAMDKGITSEQISAASKLLKKHHIKPSFFIQFGYPGETLEDIALTIKMINNLLPFEIGISVSYPLPETRFYENVKAEMSSKTNWTDSDEMALMFRNNYPPEFYKQLHRYVHKNYHQSIAVDNLMKLFNHPLTINKSKLKKALSFIYYAPAAYLEKFKLNRILRTA